MLPADSSHAICISLWLRLLRGSWQPRSKVCRMAVQSREARGWIDATWHCARSKCQCRVVALRWQIHGCLTGSCPSTRDLPKNFGQRDYTERIPRQLALMLDLCGHEWDTSPISNGDVLCRAAPRTVKSEACLRLLTCLLHSMAKMRKDFSQNPGKTGIFSTMGLPSSYPPHGIHLANFP